MLAVRRVMGAHKENEDRPQGHMAGWRQTCLKLNNYRGKTMGLSHEIVTCTM